MADAFVGLTVADSGRDGQVDIAIDIRALDSVPTRYGSGARAGARRQQDAVFDRTAPQDCLDPELTRRFPLSGSTADVTGLTPVSGVWVAGNLADPAANVLAAAASGSAAAGAINPDLIAEETRRAVRRRRDPFSHESEARLCTEVMGDRRHGL